MSAPPRALVADPVYPLLKEHVIRSTGLAYYADKDRDLVAHLAGRLGKVGLTDCASYLALLRDGARGETELDALIEDLTIGETFFFRHQELFDALRDVVLPDVLARNQDSRRLRIWSAGCATGAEPYSISILLRRDLAHLFAGWDVTILGTDINRDFLARASAGLFEDWALRATPADVRRDCFVRSGRSWLLAPEYRQGVSFQYHNLVTHPFPSLLHELFAFDVILCRNVTIYFSGDLVRHIIEHFHQTLVEGGWLLVGHAEPNLDLFRAFRTVNAPGAILYQKLAGRADTITELPPIRAAWPGPPAPAALPWTPPVLDWLPGPVRAVGLAPPPPVAVPPGDPELAAIRALADRGQWDEAERRCRQVIERDSLQPTVHYYLALVLEQTGRLAEAEQALRRVLYLDRAAVLAHYALGLLLQKRGQGRQAVQAFRNVRALLERGDAGRVFADGDGITAGELRKLTDMHLATLEGA